MNVDFFSRLVAERKRLGWRQSDMAAAGGVVTGTYSNYEKQDGRMPDAGVLMAWSRAGVDVMFLLTGEPGNATTRTEQALLNQFRQLDARGQGAVLGAVYGYNNPEATIAVTIGNVHAVNSVVNIAGVNKS